MTALLIVLCFFIIAYDLMFRRVPNSLLLLALLVHIGYMTLGGSGFLGIDVWRSLMGAAIALLVFVPLYALRIMGAGDVKFLMVLGVLLGVRGLFAVWVMGSLIAGVHAIAFYTSPIWMKYMPPGMHQVIQNVGNSQLYQHMLNGRQGRKGSPYAAYLAIGVLLYLVMTWRGQ